MLSMSVFRSEFVVFLLQSVVIPEVGGRDRTMDEKSRDQHFKANGDPW